VPTEGAFPLSYTLDSVGPIARSVAACAAADAVMAGDDPWTLEAISLPLPRAGGLPVGLMLVARNGHDRRLFRMAAAVERLFAG
jgi:aspartyl-tRNA(Asn)/glutamyl-tRNA(Gln) amidotransferase subunit A